MGLGFEKRFSEQMDKTVENHTKLIYWFVEAIVSLQSKTAVSAGVSLGR